MTLLTKLRVTGILCSFRLVPQGEAGEKIESSRLVFSEYNFALLDPEQITQSH